jgi:signal transduction histidine kinase
MIMEKKRDIENRLDETVDISALLLYMVHDLDNAVSAIRGSVERLGYELKRKPIQLGTCGAKLRDIEEICQLMHSTLQNVGSSVTIGDRPIDDKLCDIRILLRYNLNAMRPILRNRDLSEKLVEIQFDGDLPLVVVDESMFTQVFFNLLENAIRYSVADSKTPRVLVRVNKLPQGGIAIEFNDWGPGISEDDAFRVFERSTLGRRREHDRGMGLSLWVSREILRSHDCEINLSKVAKPTQFTIVIPKERVFHR